MVIKLLLQAYKGKIIWSKYRKKYGKGLAPSRYVIFPSNDPEYNAWGIYFLSHFAEENLLDKIYIISADDSVIEALKNLQTLNLEFISTTKSNVDAIIRLAALVNLTNELTIISVKEPYDTGAEYLLGKKGVGKKDIVWYDVYKLSKEPDKAIKLNTHKWKNIDMYKKYYLIL